MSIKNVFTLSEDVIVICLLKCQKKLIKIKEKDSKWNVIRYSIYAHVLNDALAEMNLINILIKYI